MATTADPAVPSTQTTWRSPSWGAIIAGACFAVAGLFLLGELCSAFGWSLARALTHPGYAHAARGLVAPAVIAAIIAAMIALFFGGWVAGHLARRTRRSESMLHGALVWALATLLAIVAAAASVGMAAGGALSLVDAALHGAGAAAGGMARGAGEALGSATRGALVQPAYAWDSIREKAQDLLGQGGAAGAAAAPTPSRDNTAENEPSAGAATGTQASAGLHGAYGLIARAFGSPDAAASEDDQRQIEAALVANARMTEPQAHAQVQIWMAEADAAKQRYEQALAAVTDRARDAAVAGERYAAIASLLAFIGTALGLVCAGIGGAVGGSTAGFHLDRAARVQPRVVRVEVEGRAHPV